MKKRAVIYSRVSTEDQGAEGTSLDSQTRDSTKHCERLGLEIVAIFEEEYSGFTLDRPKLTIAREMLRSGQADVFVAHRPNRLSRSEDGIDLSILVKEFRQLNVELHLSKHRRQVDLSNSVERLMLIIEGWKSGEEFVTLVEQMTNGRVDRAREGFVVPIGNAAFGYEKFYDKDKKRWFLRIVESEAKVIRLIFDLYVNGNGNGEPLSIYGVATKLNSLGLPPPSLMGNREEISSAVSRHRVWHDATVHRILASEAYAGVWHYGKAGGNEIIPVPIPAIIDRQIWEQAAERAKSRKSPGRKTKYQYLMNSRLKCSRCGYKSAAKTRFGNGYYRCRSREIISKTQKQCDMPTVKQENLDGAVWQWIQNIFENETILDQAIEDYKNTQEQNVKPLVDELDLIDKTLVDTRKEHADHTRTLNRLDDDMLIAIANTKNDIKRCERQIVNLESQKKRAMETIEKARQGGKNIQTAVDLVTKIKADLGVIDWQKVPFETRKYLVEQLNVCGDITIDENGDQFLEAKCYLGEEKLSLATFGAGQFCTGLVLTARLKIN